MKSKKEILYEFMLDYSYEFSNTEGENPKMDTSFLSEKLNMQRSNVSALLNQLVKEGKIIKETIISIFFNVLTVHFNIAVQRLLCIT